MASVEDAAMLDPAVAQTLEAFADTIVPGEPRFPGDVAVAGAAAGPSVAAAGAIDAFLMPEVGVGPALPDIAQLIDDRAKQYADANGLSLDPEPSPFAALSFADRTALAGELLTVGDPLHPFALLLASLASWAFDSACHEHTADAVAAGHAGLAWMGYPAPDADGAWRYPVFSYGRQLADLSPFTTPSGSPA